jgi:hypothetical protein
MTQTSPLLATALAFSLTLAAFQVQALEQASGKVILTIAGKIAEKNTSSTATFDLAMIQKLPQHTFVTMTPWDKKPIKFTGPLLRDLLSAVKASGNTLKAAAINDYMTSIPVEDAKKFDVIMAHKMNGQDIPVKTKGPLFIVYPFDTKPELQTSTYYERSAWQLKSLTIE